MPTPSTNATALERAFELAEGGACRTVSEVRMRVRLEGYSDEQLEGKALKRQLSAIIDKARADSRT